MKVLNRAKTCKESKNNYSPDTKSAYLYSRVVSVLVRYKEGSSGCATIRVQSLTIKGDY